MFALSRPLAAARRAAADPLTRGWAVVTVGSVARLGLGFVASVLTARTLGVGDFGVYVSLGAMASIVGAVADFGLTEAAVKRIAEVWNSDEGEAAERGRAFFWTRLGAAVVVVLASSLLILAARAAGLTSVPPAIPVALTLVGVVAAALSGAVSAILQATRRFGRLSAVMLVNSGATALAALVLARLGWLNLVTALVVLGSGASLLSFAVGRSLLPPGWTLAPPASRLRDEAGRLVRFGRWLGIANSLAMLAAYLDVLLVVQWSGAASGAFYGLALNLANKVDVVNQSLYAVSLPTAAGVVHGDHWSAYVRRSLRRSAVVGAIVLPLFWLAAPFIGFFYGAAYLPSAGAFSLLLGVVIFDIFTLPLTLLAFPLNEPRLLAAADAVRVLVLVAVGAWLIPIYGANGAALARLCARVVGAGLVLAVLAMRYRRGTLHLGSQR